MKNATWIVAGLLLAVAAPTVRAEPVDVYDIYLNSSFLFPGSGTFDFDAADIAAKSPDPTIVSYSFNDALVNFSSGGAAPFTASGATYDPSGNLYSIGAQFSTNDPRFHQVSLELSSNTYPTLNAYDAVDETVVGHFDSGFYTLTPVGQTSAVPEPRSLVLSCLASVAFGVYACRRLLSARFVKRPVTDGGD